MATAAIKDFLLDHDMDVYLVIFDRAAFALSKDLLGAVESYIDEHYVVTHADRRRELLEVEYEAMQDAMMAPVAAPMAASKGLDDLIDICFNSISSSPVIFINEESAIGIVLIMLPPVFCLHRKKDARKSAFSACCRP